MDLHRFLNLLAAIFGSMGSISVLKAIAGLSPDLIGRLSRSYFDFSVAHLESLAKQKADSQLGIFLFGLALVIAIVNLALVPDDVGALPRGVGIALASALAAVVYLVLFFVGGAIASHEKLAASRALVADDLSRLFDRGQMSNSDVASLRVQAQLLGMTIEGHEAPRDMLNRLAAAVGKEVPPDFDVSEEDQTPNEE